MLVSCKWRKNFRWTGLLRLQKKWCLW